MTPKVSIIIPSRNEPYLEKTIRGILKSATGSIEVIAVLDGYWPKEIVDDERVHYIHFSESRGMRASINAGVALALGEYILKSDGHCLFDDGFDEKLTQNIEENWIVIPRRYALDVDKWKIEERSDNKYPIDVMKLNERFQASPTRERKDNALIFTESFQGSCWFMHRDYFYKLKLMDDKRFGSFFHEAQEMGFKCFADGGKIMRNTKTWYAHLHKTGGRGYSLSDDSRITRKEIEKLAKEVGYV